MWQGNDHKYRVLINLIKTNKEIAEQLVFLNKRSQPLFVEILPSNGRIHALSAHKTCSE